MKDNLALQIGVTHYLGKVRYNLFKSDGSGWLMAWRRVPKIRNSDAGGSIILFSFLYVDMSELESHRLSKLIGVYIYELYHEILRSPRV